MVEALRVEGLTAGYGESIVLDAVDLALAPGASLAVLGRNGAGKSTLLAAIVGLADRHAGRIVVNGDDVSRLAPHARAARGLGWVPQERHVFASLTVDEHLAAVARPGPWTDERIYALFPSLAQRRTHLGGQLSGGEQQMLAIARALRVNPSVLLLDEPMEGLAPVVVLQLAGVIAELAREGGMAVVLVEQHARLALELTQQAIVLERGRIVHRSASRNLLDDAATLGRLLAVA